MDVAAWKATAEPSDGTASRNERVAASQMVRIGLRKRLSTLLKNFGRAPSREKENIMREFEVMLKRPQCQTQSMMSVMSTMAPVSPKTSMKICSTGCEYVLATVVSKSWIEKSREMIKKKPKTKLQPMDISTPIGADHAAFVVSSDMCADASNPVMVYCDMSIPTHA